MSAFAVQRVPWIWLVAAASVAAGVAFASLDGRDRAPPPKVSAPPPPAVTPAAPPAMIEAPNTGTCGPLDLDGDGLVDDWEEIDDTCGNGGCAYRVSFARREGPHRFAGRIEGHCPFAIAPRRDGKPADVLATWRLGCCEWVDIRYRFTRGRYRAIREDVCTDDGCTRRRPTVH